MSHSMGVVVFVGLCAVLFALVALGRSRATQWEREPSVTDDGGSKTTFQGVWLQTEPPRSSMFAYRDRRTGRLTADPARGVAEFEERGGGRKELRSLRGVQMGGRGSDFINTWIEVRYGDAGDQRTLYVNDGRWFGWRAMLSRSNLRLAESLRRLVSE